MEGRGLGTVSPVDESAPLLPSVSSPPVSSPSSVVGGSLVEPSHRRSPQGQGVLGGLTYPEKSSCFVVGMGGRG